MHCHLITDKKFKGLAQMPCRRTYKDVVISFSALKRCIVTEISSAGTASLL